MSTDRRSLGRNVTSALRGNTIYSACQFGMLSALARLTSSSELGRYALALAITGPVFVFASLKLRQVQVTDAIGEYTFGQYLGQRMLTSSAASLCLFSVVLLLRLPTRTFATVVAVTLYKALESIIDILYGAMQRREQLHLVARSQTWRGVGGLAVFVGAVAATGRSDVAAAGLAVFTVAQVASNLRRVQRLGVSVRPSFDLGVVRRLTWLTLPLAFAVSVSAFAANVPRYFIAGHQGNAELGIFAALAYMLVVTSTLVNSVAEAASPRLANLFASGDYLAFRATLFRLVLVAAGIGTVGVAGAVIAGGRALYVLLGQEYADEAQVLVILMIAAAIQYSITFFGTAVNAMRMFRIQLPINVAVLVTTIAVAAMAVPPFGITGGALAVLAGQVISALAYTGLVVRVVLPAIDDRRDPAPGVL